jgi:two-component system cell cycle sensor histidine kinase/response regulator CckA
MKFSMRIPRILVVDDTEEVRTLICRVLAGEGYEVLEAVNGVSALQACQDHPGEVPLVLTDVNMPGMSGMELAARLRSRYPDVYVLYISGQNEAEHMQGQIANSRCGFLSKPFLPQTLLQLVNRALGPARRPGTAVGLNMFSELQSKKTA